MLYNLINQSTNPIKMNEFSISIITTIKANNEEEAQRQAKGMANYLDNNYMSESETIVTPICY